MVTAIFSRTGSETCLLRGIVGEMATGSDKEGPFKGADRLFDSIFGASFQNVTRNRS